MRIAILGWGSLLWEGGPEFDNFHDEWKFDGPQVQLEFSRISKKRLGALTLVIDHEHGSPTTVAWCLSRRLQVEDAICDLRSREETTLANIGRLDVPEAPLPAGGVARNDAAEGPMIVWARSKGINVVIWTALKSNFAAQTKLPFSTVAALSYVKTLPPEGKVKAAEYVWRAPEFVQTPMRRALQQEPWFSVMAQ
ncbi:MAG: hypothetical protein M0038_09465 [Pseudomonadota bacterium]|jgi:hypothetical protein|nr:hypothetical protein [Pseudomonadota bacterium]